MPFPRAPRKPVTGKLKLVIRDKETVVESSSDYPTTDTEDLSDRLTFRVPRGFSIEMDARNLLSKHQSLAAKSLRKIRDRLHTCGSCRRKVTTAQVDLAERILNDACDVFVRGTPQPVAISTGQLPNGVIEFKFTLNKKALHLLVNTAYVEVGLYSDNALQSEFTTGYPAEVMSNAFSWLVEVV